MYKQPTLTELAMENLGVLINQNTIVHDNITDIKEIGCIHSHKKEVTV